VVNAGFADATRQLAHWESAVRRLSVLDALASKEAWDGLESYLGVALRRSMGDAVRRLDLGLDRIRHALKTDSPQANAAVHAFRLQFSRVESVLDFFINAINTRSSHRLGAQLITCDWLASQSMAKALIPLGLPRPAVLVFVDKGMGAAILKAGLKLWDGATENPVAAIKVTFHNLVRPTALIHEAGHQVAHLLRWTAELARGLHAAAPDQHKDTWAGWASEIAADAFAFVNTGYASVLALTDVLDGGPDQVYHWAEDDPHPVGWLRVLLGASMCQVCYGQGPWVEFAESWIARYPTAKAPAEVRSLLRNSTQTLPALAQAILYQPYAAFRGKSLAELIDPQRVSPLALMQMERAAGAALYTSPAWTAEGLRIVALTGFRIGTEPENAAAVLRQQETWMVDAAKHFRN
jgi:hypothetical protein